MFKLPSSFFTSWVHPGLTYELLVIAVVFVTAFGVSQVVRRLSQSKQDWKNASARRLIFPALAFTLLEIATLVLEYKTDWPLVVMDACVQLVLALGAIRMTLFGLRRAFPSSGWLHAFEKSMVWVVWVVVALNILGLLPFVIKWLQGVSLEFSRGSRLSLWTVIHGSGVVMGLVVLSMWLGNFFESRLMKTTSLDLSLRVVLSRVGKALTVLIAVLMGMSLAGLDLTMLSVFGGALGVGLGFGMQKIASNYVSGFIILLDRSIRIGDLVQLDQAEQRGVVTQITTRYTVVRALNGIHYIVPNEALVSSVVQNESYADTRMRVALRIQVAYSSNVERALAIMEDAARAEDRVLADPEPCAFLISFDDSGITLEVGWWISDPENGTAVVRSNVARVVLRTFREEKIDIPFPQREIRLLNKNDEALLKI